MPESQRHLLLVEDEAPLRAAVAAQLTDRATTSMMPARAKTQSQSSPNSRSTSSLQTCACLESTARRLSKRPSAAIPKSSPSSSRDTAR